MWNSFPTHLDCVMSLLQKQHGEGRYHYFLLSTEGEYILSFTSYIQCTIICPNLSIGVVGPTLNLWSGLITSP